MKLLIEIPTWLGDAVMVTPAIENLVSFIGHVQITLIGSFSSIEALKYHPKVYQTLVLDKKNINLYKTVRSLGKFDLFISFRGSFRSKFMKFCISSNKKYQFDKNKYKLGHQVEKYNNFINDSMNINNIPGELILYFDKNKKFKKNKLLGINPGASYGSSKRWYPKEFADVAFALSSQYDIIIFGGPREAYMADEIEKHLIGYGVQNYQNLSLKTSIKELIDQIASLDLFITGDSGPMHLAAAFKIPTVSIFGPTNDKETSQWMNTSAMIVKKSLECQPCMKRECPLKHHDCMKQIQAIDVLRAVKRLN